MRFTSISALASEATNIIHRRAFYRDAGYTSAGRAVSKKLRRMRDPAAGFFRLDLASGTIGIGGVVAHYFQTETAVDTPRCHDASISAHAVLLDPAGVSSDHRLAVAYCCLPGFRPCLFRACGPRNLMKITQR